MVNRWSGSPETMLYRIGGWPGRRNIWMRKEDSKYTVQACLVPRHIRCLLCWILYQKQKKYSLYCIKKWWRQFSDIRYSIIFWIGLKIVVQISRWWTSDSTSIVSIFPDCGQPSEIDRTTIYSAHKYLCISIILLSNSYCLLYWETIYVNCVR